MGASAGLQALRNTSGAGFLAAEGLLKQLLGLGAPAGPIQLRCEVNLTLVEPRGQWPECLGATS